MTDPPPTKASTPRTLPLLWHADSGRWHGVAGERAPDSGLGRAGPAGVVSARRGDLVVSQCYLTGLVEQAWLPARPDPAQRALLDRTCEVVPDLAEPADDEVRHVVVRPVEDRVDVFLWSRIVVDLAEAGHRLVDGGPAARMLAIEWAATLAGLHLEAPDLGLEAALREALAAVDPQAPIDLPEPERGRGTDHSFAARDQVGAAARSWRMALLGVGDPVASALADSLARIARVGGLTLPDVTLGGAAVRAPLRGPATAISPDPAQSWPRSRVVSSVGQRRDLEPGPSHLLAIDPDGRIVVDDTTARRCSLVAGPTASLRPLADGWYTSEVTLSASAHRGESRWVVAYDADGAVVGASPLRPPRDEVQPAQAEARVAATAQPAMAWFDAHPWRRSDGLRGLALVESALDAARRGALLDSVLLDGTADWGDAAAAWLDAGAVDRAAWAWTRSGGTDSERAAALGDRGVPSPREAAAVLSAVVATGYLPTDRVLAGPAWVHAATVDELTGGRGDA